MYFDFSPHEKFCFIAFNESLSIDLAKKMIIFGLMAARMLITVIVSVR
jgi:hypothetical protein